MDYPKELLCPISHELMMDPVVCCEDGYTYERSEILKVIGSISPITRQKINLDNLISNRALKDACDNYRITIAKGIKTQLETCTNDEKQEYEEFLEVQGEVIKKRKRHDSFELNTKIKSNYFIRQKKLKKLKFYKKAIHQDTSMIKVSDIMKSNMDTLVLCINDADIKGEENNAIQKKLIELNNLCGNDLSKSDEYHDEFIRLSEQSDKLNGILSYYAETIGKHTAMIIPALKNICESFCECVD